MVEEHLTIEKIENEIKEITKDLETYLTKREINFEKTQPKATKYDKLLVSGSRPLNDNFTYYVIKKEDLDETIESKVVALKSWQQKLLDFLIKKNENDYKETIIYFRDKKKLKWKEIAKLTGFSIRHVIRIYGRR